jgi:hypothetical protein
LVLTEESSAIGLDELASLRGLDREILEELAEAGCLSRRHGRAASAASTRVAPGWCDGRGGWAAISASILLASPVPCRCWPASKRWKRDCGIWNTHCADEKGTVRPAVPLAGGDNGAVRRCPQILWKTLWSRALSLAMVGLSSACNKSVQTENEPRSGQCGKSCPGP